MIHPFRENSMNNPKSYWFVFQKWCK